MCKWTVSNGNCTSRYTNRVSPNGQHNIHLYDVRRCVGQQSSAPFTSIGSDFNLKIECGPTSVGLRGEDIKIINESVRKASQ